MAPGSGTGEEGTALGAGNSGGEVSSWGSRKRRRAGLGGGDARRMGNRAKARMEEGGRVVGRGNFVSRSGALRRRLSLTSQLS
eukprot:3323395-Prymnesium_polylepis.1